MTIARREIMRSLRRILAHGRLDGLPKREQDRQILYGLCAWRVRECGADTELAINETLAGWLAGFCHAVNVDHVTFRRALVDEGFVGRSDDGSRYWVNEQKVHRTISPDALDVDPGEVLRDASQDREARKRRYLGAGD